jgi:hypothetical protein
MDGLARIIAEQDAIEKLFMEDFEALERLAETEPDLDVMEAIERVTSERN